MLGFLVRRLGDAELAADVASEVFAAAFLASARYDPSRGAANSWLYGIVVNQLGIGGADFAIFSLWLPEVYPTHARAGGFACSSRRSGGSRAPG